MVELKQLSNHDLAVQFKKLDEQIHVLCKYNVLELFTYTQLEIEMRDRGLLK